MPAPICEERFGSPRRTEGKTRSATLSYQAMFYDDATRAMAAIIATSPVYFAGLYRQQITNFEEVGPSIWFADVEYAVSDSEQGSWDLTFDGSGGSQRITQSIRTRSRTAILGQAVDFNGAIGVADDSVEGCDIVVPKYSFTIYYRFSSYFANSHYGAVCASIVGCTNSRPFWGYAANTLLYMGPTGKISSSTGSDSHAMTIEIGHRFDYSPHSIVYIGGQQIIKYGWDYLWIRFLQKKDSTATARVPLPQAVYCEQVAEEADFASLGIGV